MVSSPDPLLLQHTFMVVGSLFELTGSCELTRHDCCEVSFGTPGVRDLGFIFRCWNATEKRVVHAFHACRSLHPNASLHRSHRTSRQKTVRAGCIVSHAQTSVLKWVFIRWISFVSHKTLGDLEENATYDGGAYTFQTHGTEGICFSMWSRFKKRAIAILRWRTTYLLLGKRSSQSRGRDFDVVFPTCERIREEALCNLCNLALLWYGTALPRFETT